MIALGGPCHYCGDSRWIQNDHFIPRARGGRDDMDNIVPACRPCNLEKHDFYLHEWYDYRLAIGACWPPVWSEEDHIKCLRRIRRNRPRKQALKIYTSEDGRFAALARWSDPAQVAAVSGVNHWSYRGPKRDLIQAYVLTNGPVSRREISVVFGLTPAATGCHLASMINSGSLIRPRRGIYDVA